jgi:hypothetical protein
MNHAGGVLEPPGGHGGHRSAGDRTVLLGPHSGRGGEGGGLAGPGRSDHYGQPFGSGQRLDHRLLLGREAVPGHGRFHPVG